MYYKIFYIDHFFILFTDSRGKGSSSNGESSGGENMSDNNMSEGVGLAIVVILQGESWEWGSGNLIDGSALASHGQIMVITLNYRLNILGKKNYIATEIFVDNYFDKLFNFGPTFVNLRKLNITKVMRYIIHYNLLIYHCFFD
jgi:hypothetical protein